MRTGNKERSVLGLLLFLSLLLHQTRAWHDLTNVDFHCWPLSASASNAQTLATTCTGVKMRWIRAPPDEIKAEEHFNVTYEMILEESFWAWGVAKGVFAGTGLGALGHSTAAEAKDWCLNTTCPAAYKDATEENCCIHHVNVHSCPLDESSYCGPWIPASGDLFTHSMVLIGPVATGNWTSAVAGLYKTGTTQIIAHFKVAQMHLALYKNTIVLPKTVCGDDNCEKDDGEDCSTCPSDCGSCPLAVWQIALIAVFSFIFVAVIVIVIGVFHWKSQKMLYDESWIIPPDQINEDKCMRGFMGSMISVNAASITDISGGYENALNQQAAQKQVFAETGIYRGKTIAIRRVKSTTKFQLTKKVRKEVKQVREMDHQCLNRFVGATLEPDKFALYMEYCPKGSLSDVLQNEDVPLNWGFRFSFANDVARGMNHLHQKKVYHGRLTSSNCIIDDRWTVKVTDYGLDTLRTSEEEDEDDIRVKEQKLQVYIAPELRDLDKKLATGPGDVYSYSIVLVEIANRTDPYGENDFYDELPPGWHPPLPDYIDDEVGSENSCPCPIKYNELIDQCWQEKPSERPTFEGIKKIINKINPNKLSPVDLMMQMMEKYSKHLEVIVAERTADLVLEKQKTDRLLYSMLPKAIADKLRQGSTISAEWFDQCTIYFSDIVGFTTISGKSTPHEVVGLLNKLYTTFDSIIDKYDVYKVETIGDAYMVVSGLPKLNGNLHAREIAYMAIDLVTACETFVIDHLPEEALKIRVGLHSGPVCAGVVGLKMPRYCLFGDTVNTASRMESNGEAYKIHISEFCYNHLKTIGGFSIEKRGTIPVKGKGDMTTYWVKGRDPAFKVPNEDKDRKVSSTTNDSGYNEKPEDLPQLPEIPVEEKLDLVDLDEPDTKESDT